jgi:hypothetical protein
MRLKAHDPRSKHIKLDTLLTEDGSARQQLHYRIYAFPHRISA